MGKKVETRAMSDKILFIYLCITGKSETMEHDKKCSPILFVLARSLAINFHKFDLNQSILNILSSLMESGMQITIY